ncbi:transcriptional regulator, LysR family [Desulfovibrio sp. X2]|nr:transcriptional regulator, LysR family [Desulfovibrio sp. X2]
MLTSDDMLFFSAVSRSSSLAAAARLLNVTPPAVTQRLRSLETRLGVQLVDRGTGRIMLTSEGELLARRSIGVLNEVEAVTEELQERRGVVSGHLHVAGPTGFGRRHIAPLVAQFHRRHPQVSISLDLSDNPLRLKPDAWDIVIHIGQLHSQPYQMAMLAPNDRILCASPDYISRRGTPGSPADLAGHDCLALRENDEDVTLWRFQRRDGSSETVRIAGGVSCNDGDVIRDWALSGLGVILRSEWDVADDLASGRLVRLLPDWTPPDAPVVALLGPRHNRAARTRYFLESFQRAFTPAPWRAATASRGSQGG